MKLHLARAKIKIVSTAQTGSLDGYLNLREVVCCVLLVPWAIEVAEAGVAAELHSLLFDIGQGLGHRLRESVVRTVMQEAESFRDLGRFIEAQDFRVGVHLPYCLAILQVDVLVAVLSIVLHGVAVLRLGAGAAHAHHLGADDIDA